MRTRMKSFARLERQVSLYGARRFRLVYGAYRDLTNIEFFNSYPPIRDSLPMSNLNSISILVFIFILYAKITRYHINFSYIYDQIYMSI